MSEKQASTIAPGWFKTADGTRERWFDGTAWTEHMRPATQSVEEAVAEAEVATEEKTPWMPFGDGSPERASTDEPAHHEPTEIVIDHGAVNSKRGRGTSPGTRLAAPSLNPSRRTVLLLLLLLAAFAVLIYVLVTQHPFSHPSGPVWVPPGQQTQSHPVG